MDMMRAPSPQGVVKASDYISGSVSFHYCMHTTIFYIYIYVCMYSSS